MNRNSNKKQSAKGPERGVSPKLLFAGLTVLALLFLVSLAAFFFNTISLGGDSSPGGRSSSSHVIDENSTSASAALGNGTSTANNNDNNNSRTHTSDDTEPNTKNGDPIKNEIETSRPLNQNDSLLSLSESHKDNAAMDNYFETVPAHDEPAFKDEDKLFEKFHPLAHQEYLRGNEFATKGEYPIAHRHYVDSINALLKDDTERRQHEYDKSWFSRCYGLIAVCLVEQHNYPAAQAHVEEALNLDPFSLENCIVRGNLFLLTKQPEKAAEFFQQLKKGGKISTFPAWAKKLAICKIPAETKKR